VASVCERFFETFSVSLWNILGEILEKFCWSDTFSNHIIFKEIQYFGLKFEFYKHYCLFLWRFSIKTYKLFHLCNPDFSQISATNKYKFFYYVFDFCYINAHESFVAASELSYYKKHLLSKWKEMENKTSINNSTIILFTYIAVHLVAIKSLCYNEILMTLKPQQITSQHQRLSAITTIKYTKYNLFYILKTAINCRHSRHILYRLLPRFLTRVMWVQLYQQHFYFN
jgi:hypothetical protein